MNTGFGVAGMISPVVFGMIVDWSGSWVVPFIVSTSLLAVGALMITTVNPTKSIAPEELGIALPALAAGAYSGK
jgi:cyanate permease